MIIGLIIALVGIGMIIRAYYPQIPFDIGAIVVIIFGILIIVGAYYGMRRR
jgi:hypothetical protein